jgi:hypothetical protein
VSDFIEFGTGMLKAGDKLQHSISIEILNQFIFIFIRRRTEQYTVTASGGVGDWGVTRN